MKTARQKAIATVEKWHKGGGDLATVIEMALKEQDRDTRHMCAEAVMALDKWSDDKSYVDNYIETDDAVAACMNAQAV